ncbi:MAG: hypothetical protein JWP97_2519 [Labilithrix sp.]|nr:hypothetical protein [Labilithrix sp.]
MYPLGLKNWIAFTEGFEGGVSCPYLDIRGKMTIAYGNLVDSPGAVSGLPLVHPDGRLATIAEKVAMFERLTAPAVAPRLAHDGWTAAARLTDLRLPRADMIALALGRLASNEAILRQRFPSFDTYPLCAQMALHSLSWACGAGFDYPKLEAAVRARDWYTASLEIHMKERTPEGKLNAGLVPRNVANKVLMRNAAKVEAFGLDPETLEWVDELSVKDVPTVRDLSIHDEPTNPGTLPSIYAGREEVTGSGGIVHPWHFYDEPPDDVA